MEITDVRCVQRQGTMSDVPEGFLEERLARPTDVYEEFRTVGAAPRREDDTDRDYHPYEEDGGFAVKQIFLEIDSDAGVTGLAGPLDRLWAYTVLDVADVLVGQNPLATERVLDVLYGHHGDATEGMHARAASAIDVALWDLRGKYYDAPVHELLGGPTRTELPAYASMLGFSVAPDDVRERAAEYAHRGFERQKWFFRHGPGSGTGGVEANLALVEAAREAVGDDYDLMFDAWRSWGFPYARDMIDRLAPYEPRWLEQPLDSQHVEKYATLAAEAPFPIAGGEQDKTRWRFHDILDAEALDVLQPDTYYAGGITEMGKICALGSAHEVPVVPHGHSVPANVQLVAAQPPSVCPLVEYLVQRNEGSQFFFETPVKPEDGVVEVPDRPGVGVSIDESKVEAEREVTLL